MKTRSFALSRLWTDASGFAYSDTMEVPGQGEFPAMQFGYGVWNEEQSRFSSNWHELATIVMSVAHRIEQLRGSVVRYVTDNWCAAACCNKGNARSPRLMKLIRELRLLQAKGDIEIEALWVSGKTIIRQGADGSSRSQPNLGQLSADPVSHDTFDPMAWPAFELSGPLGVQAHRYRDAPGVVDMSRPRNWMALHDVAGRDTYWHLRPRHVAKALERMLDAQLRQPKSTSFTVVVPVVNLIKWRKYLKHFRRKVELPVHVEGLGIVKHWLLRYEAGDGLRGKRPLREEEKWNDDYGWDSHHRSLGGGDSSN